MENGDGMENKEKKILRKGDKIQLKIAGLNTKGRAYGFYGDDENRIFPNINAAEGQIVEGIFVKRRRKYELIRCEIIDFAGRKNAIYDEIARQNGGCNYQYYSYDEQLAMKNSNIEKEVKKIAKYDFTFEEPVRSVEVEKYRNKMEFSYGNAVKDGPMILGLHKQNSFHDIVEVDGLKLMDDNFNKIYVFCNEFSKATGLDFYHRLDHIGFFRNLVIRKADFMKQILVNMVTTTQIEDEKKLEFQKGLVEGLLALELEKGFKITGILHTFNDNFSDSVVSESEEILFGKRDLEEEILGLKFKISPYSFFQTNSKTVEKLYGKVLDYLDEIEGENIHNSVVFDLFSGTGTIGQIVSKKAKQVYGIELVEEAVEKANENAKLNGIENAHFIAGDVFEKLDEFDKNGIKPDIIILDPPRAGVGEKTLNKLLKYDVKDIIYVSCNPKTFNIDLKVLQENGYELVKMVTVDMFPVTPHMEVVSRLKKLI